MNLNISSVKYRPYQHGPQLFIHFPQKVAYIVVIEFILFLLVYFLGTTANKTD